MSGENKENEEALTLRKELKTWEKAFADANGGRKPSRDDIKNNAAIGAKYREYNQLLGRAPPKPQKLETPSKRRQPRPPSAHHGLTPQKRSRPPPSVTPRRDVRANLEVMPEVEEIQPTPAFIRSALGPTPQKDGMVLGIFDMATPMVQTTAAPNSNLDHHAIEATPSKSVKSSSSVMAFSRTPQSSGKRHFLAAWAGSPLKRKPEEELEVPGSAKRLDTTPSFLRRIPLPSINEDEAEEPSGPFRKRGLVRSLSSLIQGLRKQEEKKMDDDWDIMEELEAEERGEAPKVPAPPTLFVEDSQAGEMPLGPDTAPLDSDEDGPAETAPLGRDGLPRKPWKKKGLKRQTRRVIMRPVLHKPGKEAPAGPSVETESEPVTENQPRAKRPRPAKSGEGDEGRSDDNSDDSEFEDADDEPASPARSKQMKQQQKATDKTKEHDESGAKKPGRKVNPQAHANFRKLKIKNKNSKANGRGRFGRR